jgi:pyruvyltransferase
MTSEIAAFWCRYPSARNFGDALTPWLIRKITGRYPVFAAPDDPLNKYLVAGSIIEYATATTIVWGAGLMNRDDWIDPATKIYAVRGPLTRQRALECGADCPSVYGDPALLLPRFYTPQEPKHRSRIGVVPHYFDKPTLSAYWQPSAECKLIDIQGPVESVIDEIVGCEHILSSSLHGLIVAHAYGVPAMWVKFGDKLLGDGSKFKDYLRSIGQPADQPEPLDIWTFGPEKLLSGIPEAPRHLDTSALWESCPFRINR